MTPPLAFVQPHGTLYRVGRRPDAWAWPDWTYAGDDGTFGNRYDDPLGVYRVLYACDQRAGAFAETLARFRPDLEIVAEYEQIAVEPGDADYPAIAPGIVPSEWVSARAIGSASHDGRFVDVGHSSSLAHLRTVLAARVLHYGFDDLDAGELRRRAPRAFTQELSRHLYERGHDETGAPAAGVRYGSRLGDDLGNWAIFEPDAPRDAHSEPVNAADPDLLAVFTRFGLAFG